MSSEETEAASPPWWSHRHGAKGLWTLVGNVWPPIALTGFENRRPPSRQQNEAPRGRRASPPRATKPNQIGSSTRLPRLLSRVRQATLRSRGPVQALGLDAKGENPPGTEPEVKNAS